MRACPVCEGRDTSRNEQVGAFPVHVCGDCGLWFFDSEQALPVDYNEVYKTPEYEQYHLEALLQTKDWLAFADYPTYRPFFERLGAGGGALLDVGCGVGRFCRAAHAKGWNVRGIDVSRTAIEAGRKDAPFPLAVMPIEELAGGTEKFDVVTSFEVLEHLSDPRKFVGHIAAALKPGGRFFCTVPNVDSPSVRHATRQDWVPPVHVLFFNRHSLRELLLRAGMTDVETGEIWINTPPRGGLRRLKYALLRLLGRIGRPEPMGLWALATPAGRDSAAP